MKGPTQLSWVLVLLVHASWALVVVEDAVAEEIVMVLPGEEIVDHVREVPRFVAVNNDDDNGNGYADWQDGISDLQEDDLVTLRLPHVLAGVAEAVQLDVVPREAIRLWRKPVKGKANLLRLPATWPLDSEGRPVPLFAEGIEASEDLGDVELVLSSSTEEGYETAATPVTVVDAYFELRARQTLAKVLNLLSDEQEEALERQLAGQDPFGMPIDEKAKPFKVVICPEDVVPWTTFEMEDDTIAGVDPATAKDSPQVFELSSLKEGETVMHVRIGGLSVARLPVVAFKIEWVLSYRLLGPAPKDTLSDAIREGDVDGVRDWLASHEVDLDQAGPAGRLPLHEAVTEKHPDIVRLLLASGADPNVQNSAGHTALTAAIRQQQADDVNLLLEHGADINGASRQGETPLLRAIRSDCELKFVKWVLGKGATVRVCDEAGTTPLHEAITRDREELALLLIEEGSDVSATMINGGTPIHLAALKGWAETVKTLLAKGADPQELTIGGYTAIEIAELAKHESVVQIMRDWQDESRP